MMRAFAYPTYRDKTAMNGAPNAFRGAEWVRGRWRGEGLALF